MTRALLHRLRREDGVTLSEMIVSMAMLGVLFAAFALVMGSVMRVGGEVESNSALQADVRATVDAMAAELRQAYTGNDTDAPIESMSANGIVFDTPDRQQPFHIRRIGYRTNAGALERREATSTDTDGHPWILTGYALSTWVPRFKTITGTVFKYYDDVGVEITNYANVGDVHAVEISATVATKTAPNRPYTYRTSVTLRTPLPST